MHSQVNLSNCQMSKKQLFARDLLFNTLAMMKNAALTIDCYDGQRYVLGNKNATLQAEIFVKNPELYPRMLAAGDIGAAEAYIDDWWDSSNLTNVVRFFCSNMVALKKIEQRIGLLTCWTKKIKHWRNRNTIEKSRANICAHYDIGNEFYQCFLDRNMLYSCALFLSSKDSLEQAQIQKMDRLCQMLSLSSDDHLLEIGTGWGAMAVYAAKTYGCKVTTTTISKAQYAFTKALIAKKGLEDKIQVIKQDYRELTGAYDKLVSIEMIEAVGKTYIPSFLKQCQTLLKPNGLMAVQAITVVDQRFKSYTQSVDFIQKYIFPGGFLPSITTLCEQATKHSDFVLRELKDMGLDYAKTLHQWHLRFNDKRNEIDAFGYDENFVRLWRYYFCYCEGGFQERAISAVQLLFSRPQHSQ